MPFSAYSTVAASPSMISGGSFTSVTMMVTMMEELVGKESVAVTVTL